MALERTNKKLQKQYKIDYPTVGLPRNIKPELGMGFIYMAGVGLKIGEKYQKQIRYVGLTIQTVNERFRGHKSSSQEYKLLSRTVTKTHTMVQYSGESEPDGKQNPHQLYVAMATGNGINNDNGEYAQRYVDVDVIDYVNIFDLAEKEKEHIAKAQSLSTTKYTSYQDLITHASNIIGANKIASGRGTAGDPMLNTKTHPGAVIMGTYYHLMQTGYQCVSVARLAEDIIQLVKKDNRYKNSLGSVKKVENFLIKQGVQCNKSKILTTDAEVLKIIIGADGVNYFNEPLSGVTVARITDLMLQTSGKMREQYELIISTTKDKKEIAYKIIDIMQKQIMYSFRSQILSRSYKKLGEDYSKKDYDEATKKAEKMLEKELAKLGVKK